MRFICVVLNLFTVGLALAYQQMNAHHKAKNQLAIVNQDIKSLDVRRPNEFQVIRFAKGIALGTVALYGGYKAAPLGCVEAGYSDQFTCYFSLIFGSVLATNGFAYLHYGFNSLLASEGKRDGNGSFPLEEDLSYYDDRGVYNTMFLKHINMPDLMGVIVSLFVAMLSWILMKFLI